MKLVLLNKRGKATRGYSCYKNIRKILFHVLPAAISTLDDAHVRMQSSDERPESERSMGFKNNSSNENACYN
jgi:hypothetical protein